MSRAVSAVVVCVAFTYLVVGSILGSDIFWHSRISPDWLFLVISGYFDDWDFGRFWTDDKNPQFRHRPASGCQLFRIGFGTHHRLAEIGLLS